MGWRALSGLGWFLRGPIRGVARAGMGRAVGAPGSRTHCKLRGTPFSRCPVTAHGPRGEPPTPAHGAPSYSTEIATQNGREMAEPRRKSSSRRGRSGDVFSQVTK